MLSFCLTSLIGEIETDHNLKSSGGVLHILSDVSSKFPLKATVLGFHNLDLLFSPAAQETGTEHYRGSEVKRNSVDGFSHCLVFCLLSSSVLSLFKSQTQTNMTVQSYNRLLQAV